MSPVLRGRKIKKNKKVQPAKAGKRVAAPEWFAPTCDSVIDQCDVLLSAREPRELEQRACELIGDQLHQTLQQDQAGLWFDWWFEVTVQTAAERVAASAAEAPRRLLHALTSIGAPVLASRNQSSAEMRPGFIA